MVIETWSVDGIEFTIERKPRQKNLYIKLRPETGAIHVSAPKSMPKTQITNFVRMHLEALKERQAKIRLKLENALSLESGDVVPLWGKDKILAIEPAHRSSFVFDGETITLRVKEDTLDERKVLLRVWYKEELLNRLPHVTDYCETKTGLTATSYQVRHMKTRWGSCTYKTGRIRLASKLAMYPEECLVYVVIHELIHLMEPNHGVGFYKLLGEVLPEWKTYRQLLHSSQAYFLD